MQHSALVRFFLFVFLGLGTVSFSFAQNITKSPYSIIGLGEMVYSGNAVTYSMGQCAQGFRSPYNVNLQNPASYSAFFTTNIEAGATFCSADFKNVSTQTGVNNAWISYLNFGIPLNVKRGMGLAFGATPYSSVGYNVQSKSIIPQDTFSIEGVNKYSGRGGLSRFYFGYGMKVHRLASIGINANYVYGETKNTTQILIPVNYLMFNSNEDKVTYKQGWLMDLGLQVHDTFSIDKGNLHKEYEWVFGGTITPGTQLNAEQSYILRSLPIGSGVGIKDTVYSESGTKGKVYIPLSWKAGLSFARKDLWLVSAEINGTQWSNYKSFGLTDSLRNSLGFGLGGNYTPNFKSKYYLARIEYRLGARYEKSNLSVNGTGVNAISVMAGFGLPMIKSRSKVNIGIEYQQRGSVENGLIQENYMRVFLGISFADKWFYRYRYD